MTNGKPGQVSRSKNMAAIKGKGNRSTELRLASLLRLWHLGGWRRHQAVAGCRPDFIWRDRRVAVFVDGCFWHRCPRCFQTPRNNRAFWLEKIRANVRRDKRNSRELKKAGFQVVRIWEHDLGRDSTHISRLEDTLRHLVQGR